MAAEKLKEADAIVRDEVSDMEISAQQTTLADALIARGITLARSLHMEIAQSTLERAMAVALQAGTPYKAGLAALTMLQELEHLSLQTMLANYEWASTLLPDNPNLELLRRVNNAANKVLVRLRGKMDPDEALTILLGKSG